MTREETIIAALQEEISDLQRQLIRQATERPRKQGPCRRCLEREYVPRAPADWWTKERARINSDNRRRHERRIGSQVAFLRWMEMTP